MHIDIHTRENEVVESGFVRSHIAWFGIPNGETWHTGWCSSVECSLDVCMSMAINLFESVDWSLTR